MQEIIMEKPSELMLLCTQTAPQLRTLRSVQFDNVVDDNSINLHQHLEWMSSSPAADSPKESTRKEKKEKNKVPRPMNSFMVFSHLERKRLAEDNPELHNADLSKILGRKWKTLSPLHRQPYIDEAERLRVQHTETFPDYKYKPRRRKHPKRNTKKFSTLSPNDIKLKMSVQDGIIPSTNLHPLEVGTRYVVQRGDTQSPHSQSSLNDPKSPHMQLSPVCLKIEASDNVDIPPTPGDSPAAGLEMQDIELKMNKASQQLQILPENLTTMYSFLPPTPELSPQITNPVNRPVFSFDTNPAQEVMIKTENLYNTGLLTVVTCADQTVGITDANVPTISSFGGVYPIPINAHSISLSGGTSISLSGKSIPLDEPVVSKAEMGETSELSEPPTSKVELFSDVDRDEFDQYLGEPLEKTHLSNSLRNIIAELDNFEGNQ